MVIPIWWKLGGVAALLAVLFYVLNPFGTPLNETPIITDIEKSDTPVPSATEAPMPEVLKNGETLENPVVESGSKASERPGNGIPSKNNGSVENKVSKTQSSAAEKSIVNGQETQVAGNASESKGQQTVAPIKKAAENDGNNPKSEGVAAVDNETNPRQLDAEREATDKGLHGQETAQNSLPKSQEEGIVENDLQKKPAENVEKKSIFDEIEAQNEEELAENADSKWSVGANIAPVYFNSLGEGSPIHSSFVPNSKSGEINLSYGLSVAYSVSKKLNLRTGVNKVEYGYATNDVELSSSFNPSASDQIPNINYTQSAENLFVSSKTSANALKNPDAFDFASLNNSQRDAVLSQQFGYVEVPVELDYALVDKRFGVNVVGGLSTLFLMDNSVSIASGDLTTEIGSANNLNTVNFSTNIGLGVNYKFTPKVLLNIEPVFKYQLNTFSNTSGNFQPFSLGVYSGLLFKF